VRVQDFAGLEGSAAFFTAVGVLLCGAAEWTSAFDVSVRQEFLVVCAVGLLYRFLEYVAFVV
jgi:hypothetical protein